MKIPLNEFEQHIDEDILKRGLQYFKKGYVSNVEELSGGEYEALVEGSETYTVRIEIKNGIINSSYCTCPYDWGPVCKHEAAVIFYLQQEELGLKAKSKKTLVGEASPAKKKTTKKKTIAEQVTELLDMLPPEELKGYVEELCNKDRSFRDLFLARHLHLIQPVSQDMYAKQLRFIVKSAAGRYGYLDYSAARKVGNAVHELVQVADKELEVDHLREAMYIACAILEEMTKAVEQGDDSNGDLGDGIGEAQRILSLINEAPKEESLRKELFDYGLQAFIQEKFKGWDWHYYMLEVAVELVENETEKKQVLQAIDSIKPSGDNWDSGFSNAQELRLALIRKTESEENAQQFMEANLSHHTFRRELILKAIDEKNYIQAIKWAMDGIVQDDNGKPGLAIEWRMHLLTVYQLQNDAPKTIQMARNLFFKSGRNRPQELYGIMKKFVPEAEWGAFFDRLVAEKKNESRWVDFSGLAQLYIWEEQWENLLTLLIQNTDLDNISQVEKYLAKDYASHLVGMYAAGILKYMEKSVGREHYKKTCQYIRRMIKLGGRDEADAVITKLRALYSKRRALIEELAMV